MEKDYLLSLIREQKPMTTWQQLSLSAMLAIPAIMSQISTIVMEYIDASMVGSLGASATAAVGLVSTTIWLFGGICSAASSGFCVLVAHRIGANDFVGARRVLRQSLLALALLSFLMLVVGVAISGPLPHWLGGGEDITDNASLYFLVVALTMPFLQLLNVSGGMLRASGDMRIPSILNVVMCALDVLFNFLLIFPTREISVLGISFIMPGADLGVLGAGLGTALAYVSVSLLMSYFLIVRSRGLRLSHEQGSFRPQRECVKEAYDIALPIGVQRVLLTLAQIMLTVVVAPLGTIAIAANSFGIIAESLCYMPGHGVSDSATTLVGQSVGAGRKALARRFGNINVTLGVSLMTFMGIIMYITAPWVMAMLTPDLAVRELGATCLRIEAFAEPMFAMSIVCYGVFVGAGYSKVPCILHLACIWLVRLPLSIYLAPVMGLEGVWLAMAIELCVRGLAHWYYLVGDKWLRKVKTRSQEVSMEEIVSE